MGMHAESASFNLQRNKIIMCVMYIICTRVVSHLARSDNPDIT